MFPEPAVRHRRSLRVAAVVTTLVTPLLALLLTWAVEVIAAGSLLPTESWARAAGAIVLVGIPMSALCMLLGWPLVRALERARWLTAPLICLLGALLGALCFAAAVLAFGLATPDLAGVGFGALVGLAAGSIFCVAAGIGLRRSPS